MIRYLVWITVFFFTFGFFIIKDYILTKKLKNYMVREAQNSYKDRDKIMNNNKVYKQMIRF